MRRKKVSSATGPKTPSPEKAEPEEFRMPTAEEAFAIVEAQNRNPTPESSPALAHELREMKRNLTAQSEKDPKDMSLLQRMQLMGCLMPEWVALQDWRDAKPISDDERAIVFLSVNCLTIDEIARELKIDVREVRVIHSSIRVQNRIERERAKKFGPGLGKKWIERIHQILPEAIETAYEIMKDKTAKASTRLAAADSFIDRALGKATQYVEIKDSTFKELIEKIDEVARKEKAHLTIEMSKEENCENQEEGNKIDQWVAKTKL